MVFRDDDSYKSLQESISCPSGVLYLSRSYHVFSPSQRDSGMGTMLMRLRRQKAGSGSCPMCHHSTRREGSNKNIKEKDENV